MLPHIYPCFSIQEGQGFSTQAGHRVISGAAPRFTEGSSTISMTLFLSTYANKVDRKGRVSVPAPFRTALVTQSFPGIVLFRSSTHACIEGFAYATMEELSARLDHYDLFSSAQDDLATTIFAEAVQLPFDPEGRIVIPEHLLKHAGIDEQAMFIGLGRKFQIWNAAAYEKRRDEARKQVKDKGLTLPRIAGEAA